MLDELDAVLADVVHGHPRFAELMTGPTMTASDRDRVLVELFEGRALPTVVNFLRVLNRYGRLDLLAAIVAQARVELDRRQGRRPVTVRSAVPLDESQRKAPGGPALRRSSAATPVLTAEVDPSLIAGLVVQVGDDVYDASVRTRLEAAPRPPHREKDPWQSLTPTRSPRSSSARSSSSSPRWSGPRSAACSRSATASRGSTAWPGS